MLNLVHAEIRVEGKVCDFDYLELYQSMSDHHRFTIHVNYRTHRESVWTETPEDILEQLGKQVYIKLSHRESQEVTEFLGRVTDIDIGGESGDQGYVILKGGSPTLLLDMDPSMGSFSEYTLSAIIDEVLENSGVKIRFVDKTLFKELIPYAARYQETAYAFLSRLAASCGEWFFYDGIKLVAGNPHTQEESRAVFDMELQHVNIASRIRNLNVALYDYHAGNDDVFIDDPQHIQGINTYMQVSKKQSEFFFPTQTKMPTSRKILTEKDITAQMRAFHSRNFSQMFLFTARANTCNIRLGELVATTLPKSFQVNVGLSLGRFRVIEVLHKVDKNGVYSNHFTGMAGSTEMMPAPKIPEPMAFPEPAVVVDNADPKNQGRVKVRFFWQNKFESTYWIRVQTPDAGSSDAFSTNRGFFFIPEIGDQVMVGFRQGNPSRPYVAGSLFHGMNSGGAAKENGLKRMATRSGHLLEFNDDERGDWGIRIADKNGNIIRINTKDKSIELSALETMTLKAKNVNILADENIHVEAKGDLVEEVQGSFALSVEGDVQSQVKGKVDMECKEQTVNADKIKLLSSGELQLKGQAAVKIKGGKVEVQGSSNKLELA